MSPRVGEVPRYGAHLACLAGGTICPKSHHHTTCKDAHQSENNNNYQRPRITVVESIPLQSIGFLRRRKVTPNEIRVGVLRISMASLCSPSFSIARQRFSIATNSPRHQEWGRPSSYRRRRCASGTYFQICPVNLPRNLPKYCRRDFHVLTWYLLG